MEPPLEIEELSLEDRFNEAIMIGLRTIWGVDLEKIRDEFGLDLFNQLQKGCQKFIESGLLEISENQQLKATKKGKFLIDGIASDLFIV